jgi:hypothetical protein
VTVVLEAGPVYILFIAVVRNITVKGLQWLFITASFIGVLVVSALTVYLPLQMGERAL